MSNTTYDEDRLMNRHSRKRPAKMEDERESDPNCSCPICFQVFREPYSTLCGHTFCRDCITRSVKNRPVCPTCCLEIDTKIEHFLLPNFAVSLLADSRRAILCEEKRLKGISCSGSSSLVDLMADPQLDLNTVERLIESLQKRRQQLELGDRRNRTLLLKDFLDEMIIRRQRLIGRLDDELTVLQSDRNKITAILDGDSAVRLVPQSEEMPPSSMSTLTSIRDESRNLSNNRSRLSTHFEGLERTYLEQRIPQATAVHSMEDTMQSGDLDSFSQVVECMSKFGDFRRLATLNYNVDSGPALSIVSSIEFDKDGEYLVIAGVTKKIKIYEYSSVVDNGDATHHYPLVELQCPSKISNVSWNPYTKSMLASSDYDGTVQLWDAWTGMTTRKYQEHERRCWTVQFNQVDPHLMASGSDDAKVKLWSVESDRSVATIDAKVNVCCVHFSPTSRHGLVFGSADHCVHLYDLRNASKPINVLAGHRKAVSYVKFCNPHRVVSASTDSNLRLWDVDTGQCLRTMKGHQNEKNFVGLATDGQHIVCVITCTSLEWMSALSVLECRRRF